MKLITRHAESKKIMVKLLLCRLDRVCAVLTAGRQIREHSGSVVECLTRDQGAAGRSLAGVTALWSLSKTHLS